MSKIKEFILLFMFKGGFVIGVTFISSGIIVQCKTTIIVGLILFSMFLISIPIINKCLVDGTIK